jgi:hypothetical protein
MNEITDRHLALAALGASPEAADVAARISTQLRRGELGSERARSRRRTRPVRRWVRASGMAIAALVAANLVVVRLVPAYAQAVSHAPFVSDLPRALLDVAGLSEAQVSRVSASSTSSGHTLTLLAVSADSARTVLLVQVDGRDSIPSKSAAGYYVDGTLTDQYGRTYQRTGGSGGQLWFSPLSGAATHGTVELTLRVRWIEMWPATTPGTTSTQLTSQERRVQGDWTVATTVSVRPGQPVALPAPQTVGSATYTVTSIRISGTEVTVDWKVTGDPQAAALYRQVKKNGWPHPAGDPRALGFDTSLRAWVVRSDGSDSSVPGNMDNFGYELDSEQLVSGTVQRVLPGPGDYVLRIGEPVEVVFGFKVP